MVTVSGIVESFRPLHPRRCRCGATDFTCATSQINAIETLEGCPRMPRARAVAMGVRSRRQPRRTLGGQGIVGGCAWSLPGCGAAAARDQAGLGRAVQARHGFGAPKPRARLANWPLTLIFATMLIGWPRLWRGLRWVCRQRHSSDPPQRGCRETLQLPALFPEASAQASAKCLFCHRFTRTGTPIA